jgi:non-heme chloroperoxidase
VWRATTSLACVAAWHEDFREDLAGIDAPTLVIHGDADRILPITAAGLRTAKLIKVARLLVVKDGPHRITWTHAEELNGDLLSFLGEKAYKSQKTGCLANLPARGAAVNIPIFTAQL